MYKLYKNTAPARHSPSSLQPPPPNGCEVVKGQERKIFFTSIFSWIYSIHPDFEVERCHFCFVFAKLFKFFFSLQKQRIFAGRKRSRRSMYLEPWLQATTVMYNFICMVAASVKGTLSLKSCTTLTAVESQQYFQNISKMFCRIRQRIIEKFEQLREYKKS